MRPWHTETAAFETLNTAVIYRARPCVALGCRVRQGGGQACDEGSDEESEAHVEYIEGRSLSGRCSDRLQNFGKLLGSGVGDAL